MAQLRLAGIAKRFGAAEAVAGVDLEIQAGGFCVLVGPSGCGKSTLLRLIAGLETPDAGDLFIGGRRMNDVPPAERGVAMVFQSYALYPHLTAYRNMAFGLRVAQGESVDVRVRAAARTLRIEDLLDRRPAQLSGGQRQRVAIGRAIVRQPQVFLFDEPLSNLDAALRVEMRLEIARLHRRLGTTMVYVTHDQVEAMTLADRLVVLHRGRVAQVGRPLEVYRRPADRFVAGFIGSPPMNLLPATLRENRGDAAVLELDGGPTLVLPLRLEQKAGSRVTLGIRPEHPSVATDGTLGFAVELVEELGDGRLLHGRLDGGQPFALRRHGEATAGRGERLTLALDPAHLHLFDAEGWRL